MTDPNSLIPAWNRMLDGLRDLAPKMLEKLPEHLRDDPQIQQEAGRLLLGALATRSIGAVAPGGDHPMFLPALNMVLNVYQPNADTVYRQTQITPGGSYRLRGRKGSLSIAKIGMYGPPAAGGSIQALGYHDINELPGGTDAPFDVILSPQRPEGYEGDWWELNPNTSMLNLRQVAYDWATERDPLLSIERIDIPPARRRPAASDIAQRLNTLVPATAHTAMLLLDHVDELRREGYVNDKFKEWDVVGGFGGLFGQFYYETVYDLQDDEALVIETDYPDQVAYASLLLTNEVFETTDWYNNHSSLNGAQWHRNADGKLRVVVSAKDPGVHNWLDTAGYPSGVIQGRWTDTSSTPMPTARKVPVAQVMEHLPGDMRMVTPQERDTIIRDRLAHFQQRVLW
jgi:hypothetical protein